MSVFQFGSGVLFATPNAGDLAANPTPMQFGTLQDVSVDISFDIKQLHGRNQFADDVAKGKGKITFKAKFAKFNAKLVNDIFFGGTVTAGQKKVALDESGTITTGAVTVANSANFTSDLGVRYLLTGKPLTKVASAPAVGQYSQTGGVYSFNTTENATVVLISYLWNVAGSGFGVSFTNQLMATSPKFSMTLMQQYGGNQSNLKLYRCIATKFARPTKTDDYTIIEFDGEAFADDSGSVFDFYDAE